MGAYRSRSAARTAKFCVIIELFAALYTEHSVSLNSTWLDVVGTFRHAAIINQNFFDRMQNAVPWCSCETRKSNHHRRCYLWDLQGAALGENIGDS